jgi:6-phosphogluconate dehydrogenase
MELGMIGLGRMGANMAERLVEGGHRVVGFDFNEEARVRLDQAGGTGVDSLKALVEALSAPRALWVMVPAGKPVEQTLETLSSLLDKGDIIIDGGNSNYKDTIRRAEGLLSEQLHFVDVGTSGGVWGKAEGYSMMVGGDSAAVDRLRPVLETLAPAADKGWGHVGPSGSGHFVKMVHNGIEYGMMQAYAEGFALMQRKEELGLDLQQIAEIWRHGSVVRSWLLDLTARALGENPELEGLAAWVSDSGEGRWTVQEAIDLASPAPVITAALMERFSSRDDDSYAHRMLSAMRNQFGGHAVKKLGEE